MSAVALTASSCGDLGSSTRTSNDFNSPHDNPVDDDSNTVIGDSDCEQICTVLPDEAGFTVSQRCAGALQGTTDGEVIFSETFPDNCTNIIEATVTTTTLP